MSNTSVPVSPSDCHVTPGSNSSGSTPILTRLLRWMRSKLTAITARTPKQERALGRPVAARARAVLAAGQHHQRHALGFVLHRRVVDRHLLAVGHVPRDAAFGARRQQVADADVGERAARHHAVVAAAGAVAVEVDRLDAVLHEELARGAGLGDRPGRRDVIGRHRVAERAQAPRADDRPDRPRLAA